MKKPKKSQIKIKLSMRKVTIIGAGFVGSTIAYSLIMEDNLEEIALIDIDHELVEAEVMDLQHSVPFRGNTKVKNGSYKDVRDSKIAIITCGASQKEGDTRLDLTTKNLQIVSEVAEKIFSENPEVILLIITNPVDILTHYIGEMYPDKKDRIIGSGTILDSARFRSLLSQRLQVSPQSIHAYIVGEHGDSELPLWSTATIGNVSLEDFSDLTENEKEEIFQEAKNAAYSIIKGKSATYYAISAGAGQITESILFNKRRVLPVSHDPKGRCGVEGISLSLPVVIGENGIEKRFDLKISKEERARLKYSADKLKKAYKKID